MKTLLWLDDCRDPFAPGSTWIQEYSPIGTEDVDIIWVDSYAHFVDYLYHNPLPDAICFDHDLGDALEQELHQQGMSKKEARARKHQEKTGYDCAKYLVDLCMNMKLKLPAWNIQSSNPIGKENINSLLNNYKKHFE